MYDKYILNERFKSIRILVFYDSPKFWKKINHIKNIKTFYSA